MDGISNHFRPKMHYIAGFYIYNNLFFPGDTPGSLSRSERGGTWTQTPISVCLVSVRIVAILFYETTTAFSPYSCCFLYCIQYTVRLVPWRHLHCVIWPIICVSYSAARQRLVMILVATVVVRRKCQWSQVTTPLLHIKLVLFSLKPLWQCRKWSE